MKTKLKDNMYEISSQNVALPNGDKLIIEVNGQGDNSYVVSTYLVEELPTKSLLPWQSANV